MPPARRLSGVELPSSTDNAGRHGEDVTNMPAGLRKAFEAQCGGDGDVLWWSQKSYEFLLMPFWEFSNVDLVAAIFPCVGNECGALAFVPCCLPLNLGSYRKAKMHEEGHALCVTESAIYSFKAAEGVQATQEYTLVHRDDMQTLGNMQGYHKVYTNAYCCSGERVVSGIKWKTPGRTVPGCEPKLETHSFDDAAGDVTKVSA